MVDYDSPVLSIKVLYMRKVNWSLLRAGLPLLWKLTVHPSASVPAEDVSLRFYLPPYLGVINDLW
jgi:hypothetical protein